jgi:hypothetical protein
MAAALAQTRPAALVEPHASFIFTCSIRHDDQVVALGPMLSVSDRFRFFESDWAAAKPHRAATNVPPRATRLLKSE